MPMLLLIDADPATTLHLHAILPPHASWHIFTACDSLHGLARAMEHHATLDVIVLDSDLPDVAGHHLGEYLQLVAPTVPVIGMSRSMEADATVATWGYRAVVQKPLQPAAVLATLARVLAMGGDHPPATTPLAPAHTSFDRQRVPTAQLQDLNLHRVEHHITTAVARRDYDGPLDPLTFLVQHGGAVAENAILVPTYAGLLMFADDPVPWIPGGGIDVAVFHATVPAIETMSFRQTITGPLPQVLTQTIALLWALIPHRTHLDDGVERVEDHAYPRLVLRELTMNALCHRDWSWTGSAIQIRVFPNRIEWITPGGLPIGVTIDTLREAQVTRNSALATFLYQAGFVERFGFGMDMVYQMLALHGRSAPIARNVAGWFSFTAFRTPRIPVAPLVHAAVDPRYASLTTRQQELLHVVDLHGTLLAQNIVDLLHLSQRSVQRELHTLVDQGWLIAIGATRSRRYRCAPAREADTP